MNITAVEKLMYNVMKAMYESGIPINFKGSMVLKVCLLEQGYEEETRHTVDIDGNWCSDKPPTPEKIVESLQKAIDYAGLDLNVTLYRMYGEGRSAGLEVSDKKSGNILFTMDIDVNKHIQLTKVYEIGEFKFCGIAPVQMIADKIEAISNDRVFRRIKDVVDLYYFSNVFDFDSESVLAALEANGKKLNDFNGFLNRTEDLKNAYDKFRITGSVYKPPFEDMYEAVKKYIKDLLPNN